MRNKIASYSGHPDLVGFFVLFLTLCDNCFEGNESTDKLEMRSVERGICPIATSIMNELFQ